MSTQEAFNELKALGYNVTMATDVKDMLCLDPEDGDFIIEELEYNAFSFPDDVEEIIERHHLFGDWYDYGIAFVTPNDPAA